MEKEERNSTNMTVGVVLTVAVAILLLVAMIPAMMPAGDDPEAAPYVRLTNEPYEGQWTTAEYVDGTTTITVTMPNDGDSYLMKVRNSDLPGSTIGTIYFDTYNHPGPGEVTKVWYNGESLAYKSGSTTRAFTESDASALDWTISPGYNADTLAAMFSCTTVIGPDDPVPTGDAPVDTNTVLIGAIISLMFISIALVAVRSFRA